jgi:two-component system OmpR family sensor kinase
VARAEERRLTFANELPAGATATAGAEQLRVVVSNLLSNAVSYTAPGGRIRVRAGGAGVVLEVDDSGPPIPEQVLPHIFERFVRGDAARSEGGVHCGIGLALARGLCAAMNLQVTARNTDEGGVSFRVSRAG